MKTTLWLVSLMAFVPVGVSLAQRGPQPDLATCGQHDDVEVICGARSPEDFERTPDGRQLVVAEFGRGAATGTGLVLFDPDSKSFEDLPVRSEPRQGWDDDSCSQTEGMRLNPHGISLSTHPDGATGLYVVNHYQRESIEMFELDETQQGWELIWHGWLETEEDYNDLAMMPDGGFVGTRPSALQEPGGNAFGGGTSGNVARWIPGSGEQVLQGTESGFPNGVAVGPDGRYAYIAAWTG